VKKEQKKPEPKQEEKIIMVLGQARKKKKRARNKALLYLRWSSNLAKRKPGMKVAGRSPLLNLYLK
jgi:hypothetical protein